MDKKTIETFRQQARECAEQLTERIKTTPGVQITDDIAFIAWSFHGIANLLEGIEKRWPNVEQGLRQ